MSKTAEERFWEKVDKTESCWIWTASRVTGRGLSYGSFLLNKKRRAAHRVSYLLKHGELPDGLDLDHLCRNTLCVNPDHLEAVTHKENVLRGTGPTAINSRKTHCNQGHELNTENTYRYPAHRKGSRNCKVCRRVSDAKRRPRSYKICR